MPHLLLHRIALCCASALLVSVLQAPAHAADPPRQGSFGVKSKAGGPLLSRTELRECMARDERVRTQAAETARLQAQLDQEKAEVTRLGATLKAQMEALDRTSADAVNAYNEQAQAFDKRVDAYNAGTPAFNAKVEALQREREAFAKGCENRRFDEKDEIAIKNGK